MGSVSKKKESSMGVKIGVAISCVLWLVYIAMRVLPTADAKIIVDVGTESTSLVNELGTKYDGYVTTGKELNDGLKQRILDGGLFVSYPGSSTKLEDSKEYLLDFDNTTAVITIKLN